MDIYTKMRDSLGATCGGSCREKCLLNRILHAAGIYNYLIYNIMHLICSIVMSPLLLAVKELLKHSCIDKVTSDDLIYKTTLLTSQHETTWHSTITKRHNTSTAGVKHGTAGVKHGTTRVQHNIKFILIYLYYPCILRTCYIKL